MPNFTNYNFGGGGVNIVKDPLQLSDSELTQAQNAELIPDASRGGEGALAKRGGLSALTSALAGSILGIVGLPLQTTYTRTLLVGLGNEDSDTMVKSTTGSSGSWTQISTPSRPARRYDKYHSLAGQSSLIYCDRRAVSYKQFSVYPGDDYTVDSSNPPLVSWNGTASYELMRIPVGPNSDGTEPTAITDMLAANGKIYIAVAERAASGAFHGGRVLCLDPRTAILSQVANAIGTQTGEVGGSANPTCLAWHLGKLFVGLHATNSGSADVGKVICCYPDFDTEWTTDVSNLNGKPNSLCVFNGNLYAGTSLSDGIGTITKRTASSGAWADVDTLAQSHYSRLTVYNDTLYAVRYCDDASDSLVIRSSTDGASWSTARDVYANDSSSVLQYPCGSMVFNSKVYFAFSSTGASDSGTDGFILEYNGSSWTKVYTGNVTGPMIVLVERS
jgi:hypothetical protein